MENPTIITTKKIVVLIPIFNDWSSVKQLILNLDRALANLTQTVAVIVVDDGSVNLPIINLASNLHKVSSVDILPLRRNLGHQRAIAIGLSYVQHSVPCDHVVVMDGDGEDKAEDVPLLLRLSDTEGENKIVFAQRARRSEGVKFRAGYQLFKILQRFLTGQKIEVGNFSVVPFAMLERLTSVSELWNHYSASVIHARFPIATLPLARGSRIDGESKMNFTALVTHGLSAISIYGDIVGVRMMTYASALGALMLMVLIAVVGVRFLTDLAIPGWATTAFGIVSLLLMNILTLMFGFVIFILQSRSAAGFLPVRDWHYFVSKVLRVYG